MSAWKVHTVHFFVVCTQYDKVFNSSHSLSHSLKSFLASLGGTEHHRCGMVYKAPPYILLRFIVSLSFSLVLTLSLCSLALLPRSDPSLCSLSCLPLRHALPYLTMNHRIGMIELTKKESSTANIFVAVQVPIISGGLHW